MSVVRGGGLAGTVLTVVVDTADLDEDAAAALRALAGAVDVPGLDDRARTGRPDGVRVELAVSPDDGDGEPDRVRFDEHDAPDGARDLVRWVLDRPEAVRRSAR